MLTGTVGRPTSGFMEYETPTGIVVTDRRHSRSDPRSWPANPNFDPPPPDQPGVGPNMSAGFGNTHVMFPDWLDGPEVQAWSGWPVEWSTPNWNSGTVGTPGIISKISTVFGCIDLNASITSTMPPYRMEGNKVVAPLPWMKNPQPEVYTGWTEAMKQVVISYWCGEAFLWATGRNGDGSVRNWVMLDPAWVEVKVLGHIRRYFMGDIDISEDVLHLRYASWPGYARGFGPLGALASNIFGIEALERYASNLAVRGGIPWGVLTAPGNLTREQATALRTNFVSARASSMGAPATLSGGVTLTPFNLNPRDMALLELRQFDEARIAILLGVPPLLMGLPAGDSMTYRNAEGIYDFHWRAYLRPKVSAIMEAISHWALPPSQSIELNRDEYVRPDFNNRVAGYSQLFNIFDPATGERAISVEEIREAERLTLLGPNALAITSGQDA